MKIIQQNAWVSPVLGENGCMYRLTSGREIKCLDNISLLDIGIIYLRYLKLMSKPVKTCLQKDKANVDLHCSAVTPTQQKQWRELKLTSVDHRLWEAVRFDLNKNYNQKFSINDCDQTTDRPMGASAVSGRLLQPNSAELLKAEVQTEGGGLRLGPSHGAPPELHGLNGAALLTHGAGVFLEQSLAFGVTLFHHLSKCNRTPF